jgi:chromosome transmission fidelity protein 8
MPIANIDYSKANERLNSEPMNTGNAIDNVLSTPFGLVLLEIQGELNIPHEVTTNNLQDFITVDSIHRAVKFGQLKVDEKDPKKLTLFVGNSQRLIGDLVKLNPPLAVLKVPIDKSDLIKNKSIDMIDIIENKLIFKERPLPIM